MIVAAIIVAAGRGARMGGPGPKILMPLAGSSILARAVGAFASHPRIGPLVVVAAAVDQARSALGALASRVALVRGGPERQDSVRLGLDALEEASIVLVHDAARPLVEARLIDAVIDGASRHGAAVPAIAPSDTVKRVGEDDAVESTIPRDRLRLAQTPQGFRIDVLRSAYERAARDNFLGTDDAQLVERAGAKVVLVEGSPRNIKITRPSDLLLAEALLPRAPAGLRIGCGADIHSLARGRRLIVGGVEIPHDRGLVGHSDADVLSHAVCDAILGALGLPDMGQRFPDTDPSLRGRSSLLFIGDVMAEARSMGFEIVNIDAVILAEAPRLEPRLAEMRQTIALALGCDPSVVGVKAKRCEGLGAVGRKEGMMAQAVVLLGPRGAAGPAAPGTVPGTRRGRGRRGAASGGR